MSAAREKIIVRLAGARRVDALVGEHVVYTDQPLSAGGENSAPSPVQLFLASIGTCAGVFVQTFCQKREIPATDIWIVLTPGFSDAGLLTSIDLDVRLPREFPEKYRDAILAVVDQCSVKKAIAAQPTFTVRAGVGPA